MGVIVTFDPNAFIRLFPQFSSITPEMFTQVILPLAQQYCRNDGGGPVATAASQTNLLNLMVAHICQLFYPNGPNGPAGPLVGMIKSVTEGSVDVSVEFPLTQNNAWYMQTPFGAAFWQASAAYRTMRYIPRLNRNFNPWPIQ